MSGKCQWEMYADDDWVYESKCGFEWEFDYGLTLEDMGMAYCPKCGKEIEDITPGFNNISPLERNIIANLPKEMGWMTRDKAGTLNIHPSEPEKRFYNAWLSDCSVDLPLDNLFKHVKWEDTKAWNFREVK